MYDRTPIEPLLDLEPEVGDQLCEAIAGFTGQSSTLESAIGALVIGQHFGMKALRVIHSPATIRKYDRTLGLRLADHCPAETHLSDKVIGYRFAKKIGAFWDVVTGRRTIANKGMATDDEVPGL